MKKILTVLLLAGCITACNNSGNSETKETIDSLDKRKDTLEKNIDSSTKAKVDSLNNRKEKLSDKVDSSFKAKKDSVKGKKS
jgi:hypothetical protein